MPVLLSATETARAGMEPLAVDDDICILKHETAYTAAGESPVSVCAGDESVASHFALVTAYEDIKKRLRDTERENTLLRRRVKQLEDKVQMFIMVLHAHTQTHTNTQIYRYRYMHAYIYRFHKV